MAEPTQATPPRTLTERIALGAATLGGIGYLPVASGTWGSLATLPFCWLAYRSGPLWVHLGITLALTAIAFPAATVAERLLGKKDASPVVVDEAAGQFVALLGIPIAIGPWAVGFFLFRFFDVVKLFPANRVERLRGGAGIVGDDLVAGVYANLTLQLGLRLWASLP